MTHTADTQHMWHEYIEINKTFPELWNMKSEVFKCTQLKGECCDKLLD